MKKLLFIFLLFSSFLSFSQSDKIFSFGFTRGVMLLNDTPVVYFKTYTNVDLICEFIYISSCSDTLYHFLISDSDKYPLNRIILEKIDSVNYKPTFYKFKDTLQIEMNYKREVRFRNKNKAVHLYNK